MNIEELKIWIKENFINEDGNPNTTRFTKSWIEKNNLYDIIESINKHTSFLDENTSLSERIYCILNDIDSKIICPSCGKNKTYACFLRGYKNCINLQSHKKQNK